jgi:hypothetical protein
MRTLGNALSTRIKISCRIGTVGQLGLRVVKDGDVIGDCL